MPKYVYKCGKCKSVYEIVHPISETDKIQFCPIDNGELFRVPQPFSVNWDGLPPSKEGEVDPDLKRHLNEPGYSRQAYWEAKENGV